MTRIVAPEICPDCGKGSVCLIAKSGRTRRGGKPIPADIKIPTCDYCGAEWMDDKTARTLSALDKEKGKAISTLEEIIGFTNFLIFISIFLGCVTLLGFYLSLFLHLLTRR